MASPRPASYRGESCRRAVEAMRRFVPSRTPLGCHAQLGSHPLRKRRCAASSARLMMTMSRGYGAGYERPARQEVGAQIATYLGTQFAPIGVETRRPLRWSPIVTGEGPAPTDSIVQYIPTAQPGGRAPHAWETCASCRAPQQLTRCVAMCCDTQCRMAQRLDAPRRVALPTVMSVSPTLGKAFGNLAGIDPVSIPRGFPDLQGLMGWTTGASF
jgi:hypothetical protein